MRFVGKVGTLTLIVLTIEFLASGCQKRPEDVVQFGTLFGRVTLQGKPVTGGLLIFRPKQEQGNALKETKITIKADGSYEGPIPIGEMQVAVDTENVRRGLAGDKGIVNTSSFSRQMAAKYKDNKDVDPKDIKPPKGGQQENAPSPFAGMTYVPIPAKYQDPKESGLSVAVQEGREEKNFDLP
jgi:hypothetical protein